MTKTVFQCILLLNILVYFTQAALVKYQEPQSNNQQSYTQNSLEETRFESRTNENSGTLRKNNNFEYDHVNDLGNRVVDSFDYRYPDGSYEFRYELSDGQARYERGYFININGKKSLVVVGYYSYRMPNGNYLTVFYNADRHGYRQNQAITRDVVPDLPRTIDVPQFKDSPSEDVPATTTQKSYYNNASVTTKRIRS